MVIFLAGAALALLGVVSAGFLVIAPLSDAAAAPGWVLWVMFPLLTLVGWSLVVAGSRDPLVRLPTQLVAVLLLLVALLAAGVLVGHGAGVLSVVHGTASLWYVMGVGGVLGLVGSAAMARRPAA